MTIPILFFPVSSTISLFPKGCGKDVENEMESRPQYTQRRDKTVSYTHLTLPTILRV